jgi:hypothetical protein
MLLLAAAASLALRSAAADPMVAVNTVAATPGSTAVVPIGLSGDVRGVSGIELTVTTTAPSEGQSSLLGTTLEAQSVFSQFTNALFEWAVQDGVVRAAMVKAEPVDGPLAVLTLRVPVPADAAPGTVYPLALTVKLTGPEGEFLGATAQNGAINVQQ